MRRTMVTVGFVVVSLLAASGMGAAQSLSGSADSETSASAEQAVELEDEEQYHTMEDDGEASGEAYAESHVEVDAGSALEAVDEVRSSLEIEQEHDEQNDAEEDEQTSEDTEQDADAEEEHEASEDEETTADSEEELTVEGSSEGSVHARSNASDEQRGNVSEDSRADEDDDRERPDDRPEDDRRLGNIEVYTGGDEDAEGDARTKIRSQMEALVDFRQNEPRIEFEDEHEHKEDADANTDAEKGLDVQPLEHEIEFDKEDSAEGGFSTDLGFSSAFHATTDGLASSFTRVRGTVDQVVGSLQGLVSSSASSSTEVTGQVTSSVSDAVTGTAGASGRVTSEAGSAVNEVSVPEAKAPQADADLDSEIRSQTNVASSVTGESGVGI